MNTNLYATVRDYEQRVVEPALGEHVRDHNTRSIAFECLTWNAQAQEYEDLTDEEEFWAIVEKHRFPFEDREGIITFNSKRGGRDEWTLEACVEKSGVQIGAYRVIHIFKNGVQTVKVKNLLKRRAKTLTILSEKSRRLGAAEVANLAREAIREGRI